MFDSGDGNGKTNELPMAAEPGRIPVTSSEYSVDNQESAKKAIEVERKSSGKRCSQR